jgi:hypothetical protein
MKGVNLIGALIMLCVMILPNRAQSQADTTDLGNALNKKLDVYVFPANGQTQEQQNEDQNYCYKWGKDQSGVDPMNPPKVEAQQVDKGPDGSAVRGAAKGAAVGAAIGAITGDAGQGAAVGAVAGGVGGHRTGRARRGMGQAAANAEAVDTEQGMMNSFIKAYQVCLEGKGYTVK